MVENKVENKVAHKVNFRLLSLVTAASKYRFCQFVFVCLSVYPERQTKLIIK